MENLVCVSYTWLEEIFCVAVFKASVQVVLQLYNSGCITVADCFYLVYHLEKHSKNEEIRELDKNLHLLDYA